MYYSSFSGGENKVKDASFGFKEEKPFLKKETFEIDVRKLSDNI